MKLSRLASLGLGLLVCVALLAACPGKPARSRPASQSAEMNEQQIREKVDHVRGALEQRKREGKDPAPVYRLMAQIEPLMKQGRENEAMAKLEEALAMVDPDYYAAGGAAASARPGPPPPAPVGPAGKGWRHASLEPAPRSICGARSGQPEPSPMRWSRTGTIRPS